MKYRGRGLRRQPCQNWKKLDVLRHVNITIIGRKVTKQNAMKCYGMLRSGTQNKIFTERT